VEDEQLLQWHGYVEGVLEGSIEPRVAGVRVSARQWFSDVRLLVSWVLFGGDASLATGLGAQVESSWSSYCDERNRRMLEYRGKKGTPLRFYARTPLPVEMMVSVRHVLPVLLEENHDRFVKRVRSLRRAMFTESRKSLSSTHRSLPPSLPMRVAVLEATLDDDKALHYVVNHPLRARRTRSDYLSDEDARIIKEALPHLYDRMPAGLVEYGLLVMARVMAEPDAKRWQDVIDEHDPASTKHFIVRLIHASRKAGSSRELARCLVRLGLGLPLSTHPVLEGADEPEVRRTVEPLGGTGFDPSRADGVDVPTVYWLDRFEARFAFMFAESAARQTIRRTAVSVLLRAQADPRAIAGAMDHLDVADEDREQVWQEALVLLGTPKRAALREQLHFELGWLASQPSRKRPLAGSTGHEALADIPLEDWWFILHRAGFNLAQRPKVRSYHAALVWERLTGRDARHSPAFIELDNSVASKREVLRRVRQQLGEPLNAILDAYVAYLAFGGVQGKFAAHALAQSSLPWAGLAGFAFEPRHVPQLIWWSLYEEKFRPYFEEFDAMDVTVRAALSIELDQRVACTSRHEVGAYLGIPNRRVGGGISRVTEYMKSRRDWKQMDGLLDEACRNLAADASKIDYAWRRRQLNDFVEIPESDWKEIVASAGVHPGKRGGKRVYSAVWLWTELTGGDPTFSPAFLRAATHSPRATVLVLYRVYCRRHLPSLAPILREWGANLLGERNAVDPRQSVLDRTPSRKGIATLH